MFLPPQNRVTSKAGIRSWKRTYERSSQYPTGMKKHAWSLLTGLRIWVLSLARISNCRGGISCHHGSPCRAMAFIRRGCVSIRPWQAVLRYQPKTPCPVYHYQPKYQIDFFFLLEQMYKLTNRKVWPVKMTMYIDSSYLDVFGRTAYLKFTKEGTQYQCFFISKWQWQAWFITVSRATFKM